MTSVTAVVPTRNRRTLLKQALASIEAQTRPPDEVIVVDDGSDDGSGDVARQAALPLRVIRLEGEGRSAARNAAIAAASADLIAFLDSDDIWEPDKLERQVRTMAAERADMLAGHVWVIDEEGKQLDWQTETYRQAAGALAAAGCSATAMIRRPGILTSSIVAQKAAIEEAGGFRVTMDGNEDWDLWVSLARSSRVRVEPWPPVASYRVHGGNTDSETMAAGALQLAERHLALTPQLPQEALALLRIHQARSFGTLGAPRQAIGALWSSMRLAPLTAVRAGSMRLLASSVLRVVAPRSREELPA